MYYNLISRFSTVSKAFSASVCHFSCVHVWKDVGLLELFLRPFMPFQWHCFGIQSHSSIWFLHINISNLRLFGTAKPN